MKTKSEVRRAALLAYKSINGMEHGSGTDRALLFFKAFVSNGGLVLDADVWQPGAELKLASAIEKALKMGWDSSRAANEIVYSGEIHDLIHPNVDMQEYLHGGNPVASIFRTEINRANGEAFMATGERTPGFAGWRFLLSPMHPAPDICDLLAAQNLHGLGPGVYPDRARCPWPAHPNTLSFVEIVFQDEITDTDRAGKETELQALQRLAPKIRAGVSALIK